MSFLLLSTFLAESDEPADTLIFGDVAVIHRQLDRTLKRPPFVPLTVTYRTRSRGRVWVAGRSQTAFIRGLPSPPLPRLVLPAGWVSLTPRPVGAWRGRGTVGLYGSAKTGWRRHVLAATQAGLVECRGTAVTAWRRLGLAAAEDDEMALLEDWW